MLNQVFYPSRSRRSARLRSVAISLVLLLSGCSQLPQLQLPVRLADARLDLEVDDAAPGQYTVSGTANLPEKTRLVVLAVRYLHLNDRAVMEADPTFSILDYQPVEVQQGTWKTDLNLWQVASDGQYQEAWQLEQKELGLNLNPDRDVVFMALLAPVEELARIEQQLRQQRLQFADGTVRNTAEGIRYAQAHETIAVSLPTSETRPPRQRPEDRNGGWGDRYIIPQEPQNEVYLEFPGERLTNAPSSPEEFLR